MYIKYVYYSRINYFISYIIFFFIKMHKNKKNGDIYVLQLDSYAFNHKGFCFFLFFFNAVNMLRLLQIRIVII